MHFKCFVELHSVFINFDTLYYYSDELFINITPLIEYFIFTNFDNSHPKTSTGAELWADVHIAEANNLCACI